MPEALVFAGTLPPPDVPADPAGNNWRGLTGAPGTPAPTSTGGAAVLSWPSAAGAVVADGVYDIALAWPWQSGSIAGMTVETANGSFEATAQINGVPVAFLDPVLVESPEPVTVAAGVNSLHAGDNVSVLISAATVGLIGGFSGDFNMDFSTGVSALPTDATVQLTYAHSLT